MYCSHCGSAMADDLNFCKNCGARNERNIASNDGRLKGLAMSAAAFIGVTGLVGFFFVMRELLDHPLITPGATFFIVCAYLLALLIMFGIFIRLSKVDRTLWKSGSSRVPTGMRGEYIGPRNTAQLNEPHDMPASVTEHTTRTLEEVPIERN